MAGLVVLAAVFAGVALWAFRRPAGIYRRTAVGAPVAMVGALLLALLASLILGPNSGLGLAILLYAWWGLVVLAAIAEIFGASARHFWNACRR
jgi:hypothetical protein